MPWQASVLEKMFAQEMQMPSIGMSSKKYHETTLFKEYCLLDRVEIHTKLAKVPAQTTAWREPKKEVFAALVPIPMAKNMAI